MHTPCQSPRSYSGQLRLVRQVIRAIWEHPANHRRRLRAVLGGCRWQIVKRINPSTVTVKAYGLNLLLPCNRNSTSDYFYFGPCFEWETLHFCRRFLRSGDVVVDGGANIGLFTYAISSGTPGLGAIYAFEPDGAAAGVIRANVERNASLAAVSVVEAGLGASSSQMAFRNDLDVGSHLVVDEAHGVINSAWPTVSVVALDDVIGETERVALVKLDIEGAETAALHGSQRLLRSGRVDVLIVEGWDSSLRRMGSSREEMTALLTECGYLFFRYDVERMCLVGADAAVEKPDLIAVHRDFVDSLARRLILVD
jgi:FkbM family methyltransferase